MEKPVGKRSTRCGSANGMFWPLVVRPFAH